MYWRKRLFILTCFCVVFVACTPAAPPTNLQGKIVFTGTIKGKSNIYTINPNGQNLQQLTDSGEDYRPKWPPDAQKILFISNRQNKEKQIYVMDADGANQTLLIDPHFIEDTMHYRPGPSPE